MPPIPVPQRIATLLAGVLVACGGGILIDDGALGALRPESKIAAGLEEQVRRRIAGGHEDDRVPLIVQTWGTPAPEVLAKVQDLGGAHGGLFTSISGFPALVPARAVATLAGEPHVRALSYDWPINAHAEHRSRAGSPAGAIPALASFKSEVAVWGSR